MVYGASGDGAGVATARSSAKAFNDVKLRFAALWRRLGQRSRRLRHLRRRGRVVLRARGHRGSRGGRGAGAGADRPARVLRARRRARDPALRRRILGREQAAADLAAVRAGPVARARGAGVGAVVGGPGGLGGRAEPGRRHRRGRHLAAAHAAAGRRGGAWRGRSPRWTPPGGSTGPAPWSDDGLSRTRLAPVLDGDIVRRLEVGQVAYVYRGGVTFLQIKRLTGRQAAIGPGIGLDHRRAAWPTAPRRAWRGRLAGMGGVRANRRRFRCPSSGRRPGRARALPGRRRWQRECRRCRTLARCSTMHSGRGVTETSSGRARRRQPPAATARSATIRSLCLGCRRGRACRMTTCGPRGGGSRRRRTRTGRTAATRPRFGAAAAAYVMLRTGFGRGEALADLGLERGRRITVDGTRTGVARSADPACPASRPTPRASRGTGPTGGRERTCPGLTRLRELDHRGAARLMICPTRRGRPRPRRPRRYRARGPRRYPATGPRTCQAGDRAGARPGDSAGARPGDCELAAREVAAAAAADRASGRARVAGRPARPRSAWSRS